MHDTEHQEESLYGLIFSWLVAVQLGWNVCWITLFIYIHETTSGITHWYSLSLDVLEDIWFYENIIISIILISIILMEPANQKNRYDGEDSDQGTVNQRLTKN